MTRKLILAGLIGLAGRGTVFQTVVATLISFMFCLLAYRERPFESSRLNFVKICSEFQLFGILLVCVVLQASKQAEQGGISATEVLGDDGYGYCQLFLTLAIVPITFYILSKNVKDIREEIVSLAVAHGLSTRHLVGGDDAASDGKDGGRVVASNPMHEDDEDGGADVEVQKPGGEPVSATPTDAEEATAPTNDDDEENK